MEGDLRNLIDDPRFRAYHREFVEPREFDEVIQTLEDFMDSNDSEYRRIDDYYVGDCA